MKEWKRGDIAYHIQLGKVEIFEVSKRMGVSEVMTEEKRQHKDGSMRDCHIVFTKDLHESATETNCRLN